MLVQKIEDERLREVVLSAMKAEGLENSETGILGLKRLVAKKEGIKSLKGIEILKNIEELTLFNNYIEEISPVS